MMKKLFYAFIILSYLFLFSCNREYKSTEYGALMKFYTINKANDKPQIGDIVIVDVVQKIADSVFLNSNDFEEPFEILIEEPSFGGDIMCALLSMHVGDHASVVFPIDSVFSSVGEQMPDFIESGTITEMDIILKEIIKKEFLEEEFRKELDLRKNEEILELSSFYNNGKYEITEDGFYGNFGGQILSDELKKEYSKIAEEFLNIKDNPEFIAELDESDGTIQKYSPDLVVINNLEADHLDYYKNGLDDIINEFEIEEVLLPDAYTTTKTFEELDSLDMVVLPINERRTL